MILHSMPRFTPLAALVALAFALVAGPAMANQMGSDELLNIELKQADLGETLSTFAAVSGMQLDLASGVEGEVTIDVKGEAWPKILDRICRDHQLNCESVGKEPPTLRVRPADEDGEYPLPAGFAELINLSLMNADLRETLQSFSSLSGIPFDIDEEIEGSVTLQVKSTPWNILLIEVCRLSGCRIVWGENSIHVERVTASEMELFNMSLVEADLHETLNVLSSLPIFGPSGVRTEIDPTLAGGVTVELKEVNWQQALDLICEQKGCTWVAEYGDPTMLRFLPVGAEVSPSAGVEEPGAAPKVLGYRMSLPGASTQEGTARLTWADPIHVLGVQDEYRTRLSWIPFGPELSVVLPMVERCVQRQSSISLLEPTVLPLLQEVAFQAEGVMLELFPADVETQPTKPLAKGAPFCSPEKFGEVLVSVRRLVDGDSDRPQPTQIQTAGGYLLVRPVEMRQPVAAVISLGFDLDGRRSLALLYPAADHQDVELETLSLAPGEKLEQIVHADGHPYEVVIRYNE